MKINKFKIKSKEENKDYFIKTSIDEINKPLWQNIAENISIYNRFVLILSIINVFAGFLFFYSPIYNISENKLFSALISLLILSIIEILSVLSFFHSIKAIHQHKNYGYWLSGLAIIILAFNVFSSAEGNKNIINELAIKEIRLKKTLSDTINILNNQYDKQRESIINTYKTNINSIESDYKPLIENAINDANISKNENWRQNYEGTILKSNLINALNKERQSLLDDKNNSLSNLEQSFKEKLITVKSELKENITNTKQDAQNSSLVAYIFGITLVLLLITARLIKSLSMIAASNEITEKSEKKEKEEKKSSSHMTTNEPEMWEFLN